MKNIFLCLSCICACANTFETGPTKFSIQGDVPDIWDDLPEVMEYMRETEGVPAEVFETTVYLYPGYTDLKHPNKLAKCFYELDTGFIRARVTQSSAFTSCLPHEFAHRWVDVEDLDKDCKMANIHDCKGFKTTFRALKEKACQGGWLFTQNCEDYLNKLFAEP